MSTNMFPFTIQFKPYFQTQYGCAFCCDSINFLKSLPDESIDLIMTSPPFALIKKKEYGNQSSQKYVDWFVTNFAFEFKRVLKPTGSLVIDIGGSWNKGNPTRSLYHFELLIKLCSNDVGFHLAQEFYWYNPAKIPSPAQWVNIERVRVKDAVNTIWWLSKTERPKANNRNVLTPYKASMKKLLKEGYNVGPRPSGHIVGRKWMKDNGGAIPTNLLNYENILETIQDNLLEIPNTEATNKYLKACKALNIKPHPARFPANLPTFFIKFLTDPGDVVFDPFGGSCVTGEVAESLQRYWITSEVNEEYVYSSQFRFFDYSSLESKDKLIYNK